MASRTERKEEEEDDDEDEEGKNSRQIGGKEAGIRFLRWMAKTRRSAREEPLLDFGASARPSLGTRPVFHIFHLPRSLFRLRRRSRETDFSTVLSAGDFLRNLRLGRKGEEKGREEEGEQRKGCRRGEGLTRDRRAFSE